MTTSDKLREIADRYTEDYDRGIGYCPNPERSNELVSDLTALISEGYVEKAKYMNDLTDEYQRGFNDGMDEANNNDRL